MRKKIFLSISILLSFIFIVSYWICYHRSPKIKNIILLIGDGMGPQQISLAILYAKYAPHSVVPNRKLNLEYLAEEGETGMMMTYPADNLVVDSASSATQLSTGHFSRVEMVGLDQEGNRVDTILEKAKKAGKSVGLVSNTRITHATPAAFAAHEPNRFLENEIAQDLLKTQVDVMLSGGMAYWLPSDVNDKGSKNFEEMKKLIPSHIEIVSRRKDRENLLLKAKALGYQLVFTSQQLKESASPKVLGLFSSSLMPDSISMTQYRDSDDYPIPDLKEMTFKALDILSRNKKGFFLMIEGGLIDYAGHFNDVGMLLHEMLNFDETIGYVYKWVKKRKDTLVIVTADHETGAFGFSYSKYQIPEGESLPGTVFKEKLFKPTYNFGNPGILDKFYDQKKSFQNILLEFRSLPSDQQTSEQLMRLMNTYLPFKLTLEEARRILQSEPNRYYVKDHPYLSEKEEPEVCDFKEFYVYGSENRTALVARALAKQQQVVWGTGTHTSTPVSVFAFGPKKSIQAFDGLWHSTEIGNLMMQSAGL